MKNKAGCLWIDTHLSHQEVRRLEIMAAELDIDTATLTGLMLQILLKPENHWRLEEMVKKARTQPQLHALMANRPAAAPSRPR